MTPTEQAKLYGVKSLKALSEFTELTPYTLRKYHKSSPKRFKALCMACLCDEVQLTADQIRAAKLLLRGV